MTTATYRHFRRSTKQIVLRPIYLVVVLVAVVVDPLQDVDVEQADIRSSHISPFRKRK